MALCWFKKKKLWLWKAVDRIGNQLIDWECGDRSQHTLEKLWARLKKWDVDVYCTDNWESYANVLPKGKLIQSKSETDCIERNNCQQRHWFTRFHRKTISFSRSEEMVDLTMSLFALFHNGKLLDELIKIFHFMLSKVLIHSI